MDQYRRKLFPVYRKYGKRKGVDLLINGYLKYKELGGKKKLIIGGKMQEDDINTLVHDAMEKIRT